MAMGSPPLGSKGGGLASGGDADEYRPGPEGQGVPSPSPSGGQAPSASSEKEPSTSAPPSPEGGAPGAATHSGGNVGDPVPEAARQGRGNQRYADSGERLVCGCIPFLRTGGGEGGGGASTSGRGGPGGPGDPGDRVRVMIITSRGGKGWVFPKGGWELDEEVEGAAARETVEEAGVRGVLSGSPVGVFSFHSGKQERRRQADKGECIAHMFALEVREVLGSWPEGKERRRLWCAPQDAFDLLRHPWMKRAMADWARGEGIALDTQTWAAEAKPLGQVERSLETPLPLKSDGAGEPAAGPGL